MFNPVSSSRARAQRALVWQLAATLAVALAWLAVPGWRERAALAALAGGAVIVLSGWLSMQVALGGGIAGAGGALGRVMAAMLLKWAGVMLGLLMIVGAFHLHPLPILTAVVANVLAYIAANAFPYKVSK